MARCETCGNEYDKCFEVFLAGKSHTFDCFECAIQALAPACDHCGCRIVGHGVESQGAFYCCANCARQEGVQGLDDRTGASILRPQRETWHPTGVGAAPR
jgi:hypothetical protein